MSYSIEKSRSYILNFIQENNLKHEVHDFPSKCVMIDIWVNDKFYVVQLEHESLGLSEIISDEMDFSTVPDKRFYDFVEFKEQFNQLVKS
ncbi:MAG: hypothetical protein K0R51_388 [Cytophagaceae bacterium]|jgi:hypothetical protein|nr:hypothetical protein [Cytophagaceae bacterium]